MPTPNPLVPEQALIGISLLENILVPERTSLGIELLEEIRAKGEQRYMKDMTKQLLFAAVVIVQNAARVEGVEEAEILDRVRSFLIEVMVAGGDSGTP